MTDHQQVRKMLGILAAKRIQLERVHNERTDARDEILTEEIKLALADIDKPYGEKVAGLAKENAELEDKIKALAIGIGETVKGGSLNAIYNSPRITWENAGLQGFAIAHPEIEVFRKVGKPSISIRRAA